MANNKLTNNREKTDNNQANKPTNDRDSGPSALTKQ
jgi:hypothetical protein